MHNVSSILGGGGGYLSTFRGTGTWQTVTELWVSFSNFSTISRNYGCSFQESFHNFRNYGPYFHSICGIMALKSIRIYGFMGINFSGKMARPRQMIG